MSSMTALRVCYPRVSRRTWLPMWLILSGCAGNAVAPRADRDAGQLEAGLDAGREASRVDAGLSRDTPGISPPSAELKRCAELAADEDWPAPSTVAQAVDRINGLPKPVSISCFLASLPRPLRVVAADSAFSAQPSGGRRSPRLFLLQEGLVLTLVPSGPGRQLLEFGEFFAETRTIKGEVEFPVAEALDSGAPYSRVMFDETHTDCGFCHATEQRHPSIPDAFESDAYRPSPSTLVPLDEVRALAAQCDAGAEPERCEMLTALFAFGPVEQGAFSEDIPVFF